MDRPGEPPQAAGAAGAEETPPAGLAESLLAALSAAGADVFILDEGRVVYASSSSGNGIGGDDLLGVSARLVVAAKTSDPSSPERISVVRNGEILEYELDIVQLPPSASRLLVIAREVTRRLERERRERSAEKMRALGQLAAGLAHDVNNPLAVIRSNNALSIETLEAIQKLGGLGPETNEAAEKSLGELDRILNANAPMIRRIEAMVRKFGSLANPQAPRLTAEPVDELLADAIARARARYGRQCSFQAKAPAATVRCDRELMGRALDESLSNAADATGQGGRVEVRADVAEGTVRIQVLDQGPGLPPGVAERVFEPFFTTKGHGSPGLGLSLARGVVEDQGGSLSAASRDEGGAVFTLTIPLETQR